MGKQELSDVAKTFIRKHERAETTTNRSEIIAFLQRNSIPLFEPIIEFQMNFSGYILHAGLVPIYYRLIQGEGSLPFSTKTAFIDYEQVDGVDSTFRFICATSEYPMRFELDEHGRYYEDDLLVANSFQEWIEEIAFIDK